MCDTKQQSDPSDGGTRRISRAWFLAFVALGVVLASAAAGVLFDRYGPRSSAWQPVLPTPGEASSSQSMDTFVESDQTVDASEVTNPATQSENADAVSQSGQTRSVTELVMPGDFGSRSAAPDTPAEALREAEKLAEFLVAAIPEIPDALELCARIRLWLGDSDGAVNIWQECLDRWPQYAYAYHGMGRVAAEKGESTKAAQLFRKAIEREPELHEARRDLARALLDDGRAEQAIPVLKEYVARNPQRAEGYVSLGFAYQQLGDSQQAKESYQAALRRDPNHTRAVYGLATACARLGLAEAAQSNSARFREMLAAEGQVRRDERSAYDDVSALCEDLGGFYTDAARIFFSRGQVPLAEILCRRAAVVAPRQIECRQALALICRRQSRLPEAIRWLEELAGRADDPDIYEREIRQLKLELDQQRAAGAASPRGRELTPKRPDD
jgi:tetratricopeptide (TPR) repeat protein